MSLKRFFFLFLISSLFFWNMPEPIGLNAHAWKKHTHTWFDCILSSIYANAIMGLCSLSKRHSRRASLLPLHPSFQSRLIFPHYFSTFPLPISLVTPSFSSNLFVFFGCTSWLQSWARVSSRIPLPPRVYAKTKGQGCLSEHCPLPPCAAVHLQRREWPIEQEPAGS